MTDREIINYIPVLIYGLEFDPALGLQKIKIIYCNKSTLEFTNYTEPEIVNMGFEFFRSVLHPDDLIKTTQTASLLLNGNKNQHIEIYRVKAPSLNTYSYMKAYCSIIRPTAVDENVRFVVTSYPASAEEVHNHYIQANSVLNLDLHHIN